MEFSNKIAMLELYAMYTYRCASSMAYVLIAIHNIFFQAIDYLFRSFARSFIIIVAGIPIMWQCIGHHYVFFRPFSPTHFLSFKYISISLCPMNNCIERDTDGWWWWWYRCRYNNNETRIRFTAPFYDVGVYRTATRKHFMVYRLLLFLFPFLESVAA